MTTMPPTRRTEAEDETHFLINDATARAATALERIADSLEKLEKLEELPRRLRNLELVIDTKGLPA